MTPGPKAHRVKRASRARQAREVCPEQRERKAMPSPTRTSHPNSSQRSRARKVTRVTRATRVHRVCRERKAKKATPAHKAPKGAGFVGIYPANKADVTKYSTLYVDLYCGASLQYVACAGIISANVTTVMDSGASAGGYFVARQDFGKGENSLAIPVDSLSGEQRFMLMYFAPNGGDFSISNIRFA